MSGEFRLKLNVQRGGLSPTEWKFCVISLRMSMRRESRKSVIRVIWGRPAVEMAFKVTETCPAFSTVRLPGPAPRSLSERLSIVWANSRLPRVLSMRLVPFPVSEFRTLHVVQATLS